MTETSILKRRDVLPDAVIDGKPISAGGRFRRTIDRLTTTAGAHDEAEIERKLRAHPGVTRSNTIALISPKGGVGKTTSTFLLGNLLASHLKLRAIAVDANPDFGTLDRLAPDNARSSRSLADLLSDLEQVNTAAELGAYVSRMPSGLHVLGAPHDPELTAKLGPASYGDLIAFLSCFYEVVLLDLGTGVGGPLARFAVERSDQTVLVTTPEWVTASVVLDALDHLPRQQSTVLINKARARGAESAAIEQRFRAERLSLIHI